jgi:O-acetyl-ADP-ribose deacetylase (regulator of RNase III)
MVEYIINGSTLKLLRGDITKQDTQAIVNAANSSLMGGGGVDGAIHRAGGPQILEECKEIRRSKGLCNPGEAVITSGGDLKAKYVIHTVGPIWRGGNKDEDSTLQRAYENSLELAVENNIKSISFPSISTGAYGFPLERAAKIALSSIRDFVQKNPGKLEEIRMILFTEKDLKTYTKVWETI